MPRFLRLPTLLLAMVVFATIAHSDDPAAPEFLNELKRQRDRHMDEYGERHPVVQSLNAEIKRVTKQMDADAAALERSPLGRIDLDKIDDMSEEELKSVVKLLVQSMISMESEIRALKQPAPKHFLLK